MLVLAIAWCWSTRSAAAPGHGSPGTAHVVSVSEPPASSTYGRCELQIVVEAPGLPAAAVKIRDPRVPVAKWPDAGATLPILVAIDDPRHVRIQWDDVQTHAEAAADDLDDRFLDDESDLRDHDDLRNADLLDDDLRNDGLRVDDDLPGLDPIPPLQEEDLISGVDDASPEDFPDLDRPPVNVRDEPARPPRAEPVVVTQTPAGPVVEGRLVERPTSPSGTQAPTVPRPRPSPRPRPPQASPPRSGGEPTASAAASAPGTMGGATATMSATGPWWTSRPSASWTTCRRQPARPRRRWSTPRWSPRWRACPARPRTPTIWTPDPWKSRPRTRCWHS